MSYGLNIFNSSGTLVLNTDYIFANKVAEVTTYVGYQEGEVITCPVPYSGRLGAVVTTVYIFVNSTTSVTNIECHLAYNNQIVPRRVFSNGTATRTTIFFAL